MLLIVYIYIFIFCKVNIPWIGNGLHAMFHQLGACFHNIELAARRVSLGGMAPRVVAIQFHSQGVAAEASDS